jgi:hypothetical protein
MHANGCGFTTARLTCVAAQFFHERGSQQRSIRVYSRSFAVYNFRARRPPNPAAGCCNDVTPFLTVMEKAKPIALRVAELLLFFFAFGMLVPPVPSHTETVYRLTPTLVIGGSAFALSLFLAIRRRAEHWLTAALKLLFYFGLAWIIHERVFAFR